MKYQEMDALFNREAQLQHESSRSTEVAKQHCIMLVRRMVEAGGHRVLLQSEQPNEHPVCYCLCAGGHHVLFQSEQPNEHPVCYCLCAGEFYYRAGFITAASAHNSTTMQCGSSAWLFWKLSSQPPSNLCNSSLLSQTPSIWKQSPAYYGTS